MTSWNAIEPSDRDKLLTIYEARQLTEYHARRWGINLQTLKRRLRDWRSKRNEDLYEYIEGDYIPDGGGRYYDDFITMEADDFVVISDLEIPDHDPAMLQAAKLTAKAKGIRTLVIAGDALACDQQSLTTWKPIWRVGNALNLQAAIGLFALVLISLSEAFDHIVIIRGNHDDRIAKATGGELWIGMVMEFVRDRLHGDCTIEFSRYSYLYVKTTRGWTYICHPQNFSAMSVNLGCQIYDSNNGPNYDPSDLNPVTEKCHVVLAHTHNAQRGWSKDGYREIIGLGCMRDTSKTEYVMTNSNKHAEWSQGFLFAKQGYFYDVTRRGTNWHDLLGPLSAQAEVVQPNKESDLLEENVPSQEQELISA